MSHPSLASPSREDVEAQLARLLASDSFAGASRSQGFLRFIVAEDRSRREGALVGEWEGRLGLVVKLGKERRRL